MTRIVGLLLVGTLLSLSACTSQAGEEDDAEGAGSAASANEKAAPLDTKSSWPSSTTDLSWLLNQTTKTAYLYPGDDIMEDTFRPGGWAAFAPGKEAKQLQPGKAASFKLPPRSAFEYDELGVSSVVLTSKPLQYTFCVLNASKQGFCKEAGKGDGRGTAVSTAFVPSNDIMYAVIVRGRVAGTTIQPYANDVLGTESFSADAMWRMPQKPTTFPRVPMTFWGW